MSVLERHPTNSFNAAHKQVTHQPQGERAESGFSKRRRSNISLCISVSPYWQGVEVLPLFFVPQKSFKLGRKNSIGTARAHYSFDLIKERGAGENF